MKKPWRIFRCVVDGNECGSIFVNTFPQVQAASLSNLYTSHDIMTTSVDFHLRQEVDLRIENLASGVITMQKRTSLPVIMLSLLLNCNGET